MSNKIPLPIHTSQATNLTLGPYRKLLLLGGGQLLRELCSWAPFNNYSVGVITSQRHAEELFGNESLIDFLKGKNVPYLITDKIEKEDVKDFIGNAQNTFFLSLCSAWLFKAKTIEEYFENRLFNLHGARLPQNRGGGGFSWQILTGNRFGFCVLHLIDEGIDTGDIVLFDEFLYPPTCRIPLHYERIYIDKNFRFLTDLLTETKVTQKNVRLIPQAEYFSTYWPRLHTITNAWIDWLSEPYELERFICAFDSPYAGAQTLLNEKKVHIKNTSLNFQDGTFHSYQSGLIYRKTKSWICVCIKGAALIIESVIDESGNDILESMKVGDRFFTPIGKLESSKQRVIFTPTGLK
jgi:methionyl-tRNA formyltransferase